MFFVLRPVSPWYKAVVSLAPAAFGGVAISLSLCEFYALDSLYHKMLSAFFAALICMPLSSGALKVTESEAVGWIKQLIIRVLGVKAPETEEETHSTPQGGES